MTHFANIIDGKVTNVIVAEQEFINALQGDWIQTSYNTHGGIHYIPNSNEPSLDQSKALRKNYAGKGYTYDAIRNAFIPLQPYPSWLLDEDTCNWVSPVAKPTDGLRYEWDESTLAWDTPTIK